MRILLVGEGKHELSGALRAFVETMLTGSHEFDHERLANQHRVHRGKGGRFFKKAIAWALEAKRRGFDGIVLLVDQDGVRKRQRQIDKAQCDDSVTRIRRAMGVPIRTFDAWMLADEQALSQALETQIGRQRDPEANHDPKSACSELRETHRPGTRLRDLYACIAGAASPDTLIRRCPRGFAPFAERVQSLESAV